MTAQISKLSNELDELLFGDDTLVRHRNVWFRKMFLPDKEKIEELRDFQLNFDDILVASYPKSGTTWMQEIIIQIRSSEGDEVRAGNVEETFPYLEEIYPGLEVIRERPGPRLIKTHLPYDFLPTDVKDGKGKVIYIARNVKDVLVSFYYFVRMNTTCNYRGRIQDFFHDFLQGKVWYGRWRDHVQEYWQRKDISNILFIKYEDMHKNPTGTIRQVAKFLDSHLSEDRIAEIVRRTSFEEMKSNPLVNYSWWDDYGLRNKDEQEFMRNGKVGDWRNHITEEMENKLEETFLRPLKDLELMFDDTS